MHTQPLLVQLLFHPKSNGALELARRVHQQLNDDAIVPGLRVPTVFTPFTIKERPAARQRLDIAKHSFVVPLADNTLLLDPDWSRFVADVWEACSTSETGRHRCVPIQLSEKAWPLDERLREVNFDQEKGKGVDSAYCPLPLFGSPKADERVGELELPPN